MVRVGGLSYTIASARPMGRRISDVRIGDRPPLEPAPSYKTTGWASIGEADGPPAWEVVADYLRSQKRVKIAPRRRVRVV